MVNAGITKIVVKTTISARAPNSTMDNDSRILTALNNLQHFQPHSQLLLMGDFNSKNVTGFWKTDQSVTLGLFHFTGQTNGYTRTLHIHSVSIRLG